MSIAYQEELKIYLHNLATSQILCSELDFYTIATSSQ